MARSKYTTPAAAAASASKSKSKSKGLKHPKSPDAEVKVKPTKKTIVEEVKKKKQAKEPEPSDDDDDEFEPESSDEDEDEDMAVQRDPIGDKLVTPAAAASAAGAAKSKSKAQSVSARRRKATIRRADARASREQSGLFGSVSHADTRPGSFRALLSEFIPEGQTNPRISKTALELMQRGIEAASQSIILPGASQALLVSQSFATPEARDAARLSKSILGRHMDSSVRNFLFSMCPTLVPVLDDNLAYLHEMEAAKAAKRKEREEFLEGVRALKHAIDLLQEKEAAFNKDTESPLGVFTAGDRHRLITQTIEYDTIKLDMAKKAEAKIANVITNGEATIDKTKDVLIPKAKATLAKLSKELQPEVEELIEGAKLDIEKADLAFKTFMATHDAELTELNKKREKFTDEEKALRKQARDVRRNTTTQRTILETHKDRLASVHRRIKAQTKRIATLKAEIPHVEARIAKNTALLIPAQVATASWKSALAKSKRVLTKENKMDEDEKEVEEDEDE